MLSGIIVPLYPAIAVGLILLYLRLYVRHRRTRTIREQRNLAVRHEHDQQRHGH